MIGVLGGSYDPVHHGHLRLATEVREGLGLSSVRLVPLNLPKHRPPPLAPAALRLEMLRAAVAAEPHLLVDDRELRRGGISYTVDTLQSLRDEFADRPICLILGMDAFAALTTWHEWRRLPRLAHVVVARRGPGRLEPSVPPELPGASLAQSAEALSERPHGLLLFCDVPQLDISSSRIRALVRAGRSVRYLLPEAVLQLIEAHGLYR